ncbi:hypothetical protein LTR09_008011 [Extremus antarcticus]|uniref:F-box domain-containing protein n=1 Tax=Extremus antarcticus TaxID=702011 RepID=A0AAJ0DJ71_9PEZI|nr:hypothetical protein LTR09_008011 [Extremus antarcticus]
MLPQKRKAQDDTLGPQVKASRLTVGLDSDSTQPATEVEGVQTTAQQAVFNTTELLEHVLVHLPIRDILTAQRVSTRFRDIVTDSHALQRKLFFIVDAAPHIRTTNDVPKTNHTLIRPHGPHEQASLPEKSNPKVQLNPLQQEHPLHRPPTGSKRRKPSRAIRLDCELLQPLTPHSAQSSWRRMYLCDPPPPATNFVGEAKLRFPSGPPRWGDSEEVRLDRFIVAPKWDGEEEASRDRSGDGLTFGVMADDAFRSIVARDALVRARPAGIGGLEFLRGTLIVTVPVSG